MKTSMKTWKKRGKKTMKTIEELKEGLEVNNVAIPIKYND